MPELSQLDKPDTGSTYTMLDPEDNSRFQLTYKLDTDIFKLQEVITQTPVPCPKEPCPMTPPKTIFKALSPRDILNATEEHIPIEIPSPE